MGEGARDPDRQGGDGYVAPVIVREVVDDLLAQPVEALVNPWNRNFVPRWLLLTGGVSAQLKKATGPRPWRDLARMGVLRVGDAVVTSAGEMPGPQHLIHVVGLDARWRATEMAVELCARNAAASALALGLSSIAMPLIGAGHGRLSPAASREAIRRGLHVVEPAQGSSAGAVHGAPSAQLVVIVCEQPQPTAP